MDISFYDQHVDQVRKGLREQSRASIRAFIDSFENFDEKHKWIYKNMPRLLKKERGRIRHEILMELVIPVLEWGYEQKDYQAMLWLGQLEIGVIGKLGLTSRDFLERCNELRPKDDEARFLLLESLIRGLKYCAHEGPAGLVDVMNEEDCQEVRDMVTKARELDKEERHSAFLAGIDKKVEQYSKQMAQRKTE